VATLQLTVSAGIVECLADRVRRTNYTSAESLLDHAGLKRCQGRKPPRDVTYR
jgi:hypothetical protein